MVGSIACAAAALVSGWGDTGFEPVTSSVQTAEPRYRCAGVWVGDTGFEPVTSSVQTAEPRYRCAGVWVGDTGFEPVTSSVQTAEPRCRCAGVWVGDTGFEPVTSSVSRKRATAAPIAPGWCSYVVRGGYGIRTRVDGFAVRCLASRPTHRGGFGFSPSGRRGSNSRPQPWQGCALPTELRPPATAGSPAAAKETIAEVPGGTNLGCPCASDTTDPLDHAG